MSDSSTAPSSTPSIATSKYTLSGGRTDSNQSPQTQVEGPTCIAPGGLQSPANWLLFGIQGRRKTLEIENIPISNSTGDGEVFSEMKRLHTKHYGQHLEWLSPFKFQNCKFAMLQRSSAGRVISTERHCLPEDQGLGNEYDYDPRPPKAKIPLIWPTEFKLFLAACSGSCMMSRLPSYLKIPWHDCFVPPCTERRLVKKIPKRKFPFSMSMPSPPLSPPTSLPPSITPLPSLPARPASLSTSLLDSTTSSAPPDLPSDELAFGLCPVYNISFLAVFTYHILLILPAFGFWVYWLVHNPGDLQNASVPLMTVITIIAGFWATVAAVGPARAPKEGLRTEEG